MAETTVVNFRTPQEFIEYYSDNLKAELNLYDIQINKLGFLGKELKSNIILPKALAGVAKVGRYPYVAAWK